MADVRMEVREDRTSHWLSAVTLILAGLLSATVIFMSLFRGHPVLASLAILPSALAGWGALLLQKDPSDVHLAQRGDRLWLWQADRPWREYELGPTAVLEVRPRGFLRGPSIVALEGGERRRFGRNLYGPEARALVRIVTRLQLERGQQARTCNEPGDDEALPPPPHSGVQLTETLEGVDIRLPTAGWLRRRSLLRITGHGLHLGRGQDHRFAAFETIRATVIRTDALALDLGEEVVLVGKGQAPEVLGWLKGIIDRLRRRQASGLEREEAGQMGARAPAELQGMRSRSR